jgi:phosphatidylserine/phosphatidylglycerophosphate/cardiolipin synthase-like enzyme
MLTPRQYTNPSSVIALDVAALETATKTIDFAAYSLTEPTIVAAVLASATRGVTVRLYLDRSELEAEARGNPALPTMALRTLLNVPGITIKVKRSIILMHLKSYLIDARTLRDGSANFSPLGECEQDNSIVFTDDAASIGLFASKFESMWDRPDNLTVTAAVEASASYSLHRTSSH